MPKADNESQNLKDAYAFLAQEYAKVMVQAGFADSREAVLKETENWIDPSKRPSTDAE